MGRRSARKHAFCVMFQIEFHDNFNLNSILKNYLLEIKYISKNDKEFIYKECNEIYKNLVEIDTIISKNLKNWTLNRLNKVDLTILRLAIYEIIFVFEIPNRVTINEAIELAKEYSSDEAPSFINGILGHILKNIEEKIYD